jgi:hypothetical protein
MITNKGLDSTTINFLKKHPYHEDRVTESIIAEIVSCAEELEHRELDDGPFIIFDKSSRALGRHLSNLNRILRSYLISRDKFREANGWRQ